MVTLTVTQPLFFYRNIILNTHCEDDWPSKRHLQDPGQRYGESRTELSMLTAALPDSPMVTLTVTQPLFFYRNIILNTHCEDDWLSKRHLQDPGQKYGDGALDPHCSTTLQW